MGTQGTCVARRHTCASTADECAERYCSALHIDTNQGGHYRCATVLIYLDAIDAPVGGETRFPLVGAERESPLREAAERLTDLGVTAFTPSDAVEWPPLACRAALSCAAEKAGVGLRVRPQKGLACVFWTHTTAGLCPYRCARGCERPRPSSGARRL